MRDCIVLMEEFWQLVEQARRDVGVVGGRFDADALAGAMTDRLAAQSKDAILDFAERYYEVRDRLESWEMCAACYLILGYISDDTFTDFTAGVIALPLGQDAFEGAAQNPDSLAENPVVVDIANGRLKRHALSAESFGYAASDAYKRLRDGDREAYGSALRARDEAAGPRPKRVSDWDGRFGTPGDGELIPVRLPRLATLFPATARPADT